MPVTITCGCGNALHISDHLAGKRVACPSCGAMLDVPGSRNVEPGQEGAVIAAKPPQNRQLVLRSIALALGILGGLGSGGLGVLVYGETLRPYEQEIVKDAEESLAGEPRAREYLSVEQARKVLAEHRSNVVLRYLLLAGSLLGPIAGLLAFDRRRWAATAVFVIVGLAPLALLPQALIGSFPPMLGAALAVNFPLLLGAALAINIRPLRKKR
jgi:hypothetical protein